MRFNDRIKINAKWISMSGKKIDLSGNKTVIIIAIIRFNPNIKWTNQFGMHNPATKKTQSLYLAHSLTHQGLLYAIWIASDWLYWTVNILKCSHFITWIIEEKTHSNIDSLIAETRNLILPMCSSNGNAKYALKSDTDWYWCLQSQSHSITRQITLEICKERSKQKLHVWKNTFSNYSWAFRHDHVFGCFNTMIFVDVNISWHIEGTFVWFSQSEKTAKHIQQQAHRSTELDERCVWV